MLWPFEGRRLVAAHALRLALLAFFAAIVARLIVAGTLWLTDDEAVFWQLTQTLAFGASYGDQPPLPFWLTRISTALFGHSLLAIRLPSLVLAAVSTLYLVKIVVRFGWAKGSDVAALLALATPALFLAGVLAGSQALLIALWLAMIDTSFGIAHGHEKSSRPWKMLLAFSGLVLLTDSLGLLAIAAAAVSIVASTPGRHELRRHWLFAAAIGVAALAHPFAFPAIANVDELALNAVLYAALCGPALLYGWYALFRQRDFSRNRFLLIWAIAGVPSIVLACIPVMIYFAKLSLTTIRPRLVRAACASGAILSFLGLAALYGVDPGWQKIKPHLEQLPADITMVPLFAEDTRTAAQATYATREKVQALNMKGRAPASSRKLPEKFLFISKSAPKRARAQERLAGHLCEDYSRFKSIHLTYCHRPRNDRDGVKTLKPIARLQE